MDYIINTATGNTVNASLSLQIEDTVLLAIFVFELNYVIAWDVDQMVIKYTAADTTITTGRENVIPADNVIGAQLLNIATPELKRALFTQLSANEQEQISNFAVNGFSNLPIETLQESSLFTFTQNYKGIDYLVHFAKDEDSTPNSFTWEVQYIERKELWP